MNNSKIARVGLISIFFVLLLSSCNDDPLQVGLGLNPNTSLINANSDTIAIECYTVPGIPYYVSNPSSTSSTDNAPLGYVIDPIFGETVAEAVMELNFNSDNYYSVKFSDSTDTYVSCKLYLNIDDEAIYGANNGFDVDVFEMKNTLSYNYPTDYSLKSDDYYFQNNISIQTSHKYKVLDENIEGLDSGKYYLVIDLEKEFGNKFIDTNFIKEHNLYTTNFKYLVPGLYLKPKAITSEGGLNNFLYASSRMVVEYKRTYQDSNDEDSVVSKFVTFSVDNYQSFYKNSSNFYPEGPFKTVLGDTIHQGDMFYVQSLGGVRGYIKIPELETLRTIGDSNSIILAELVLQTNEDFLDTINFFNPLRLTLRTLNGVVGMVEDDSTNALYYNGYYNKKRLDYRINITEQVQKFISGKNSINRFYLLPAEGVLDFSSNVEYKIPGRVVLNSGNNSNPSYLRVIYAKSE